VSKLGLERPNLVDAMKSDQIQLLINTPSGRKGAADSSNIRRTAIRYKIPYITTTAAAIAAAKGIAAIREGEARVYPLQSYHRELRSTPPG
ncbi:MAG: hypothetical protein V2J11_10830, partial [Desulfofustis sp.]|nr:hypothetical protein [Desulfofustis sp.]